MTSGISRIWKPSEKSHASYNLATSQNKLASLDIWAYMIYLTSFAMIRFRDIQKFVKLCENLNMCLTNWPTGWLDIFLDWFGLIWCCNMHCRQLGRVPISATVLYCRTLLPSTADTTSRYPQITLFKNLPFLSFCTSDIFHTAQLAACENLFKNCFFACCPHFPPLPPTAEFYCPPFYCLRLKNLFAFSSFQ